ncbi:MAG: hypothetical protein ACJ8OJ_21660 [Povalibacter sp.]
MFDAKPLVGEFTARSEPQALMQGEEVVALVFEERYAQLLSQAPQMLELIERVAAGACEFGANGEHDCDCCACAAREFLNELPPAPLLN